MQLFVLAGRIWPSPYGGCTDGGPVAEADSRGRIFAVISVTLAAVAVLAVLSQTEKEVPWKPISTDEADVSFASLIGEMTDRSALARWPEHSWKHGHRSSTQRPVLSPESEGWHENHDAGNYVGMSNSQGRVAFVLLKQEGPGAVTRIWSANPAGAGNLAVYVDGQPVPVVYEPMDRFLSGRGTVPSPIAGVRGRGATSMLPIPYGKSIRITVEESPKSGLYYGIDYRTYPEETKIQSYTPDAFITEQDTVTAAAELLRKPIDPEFQERASGAPLTWTSSQPGAVAGIRVVFPEGLDPTPHQLVITLDDSETVDVTVGDFFGSGTGVNPFEDWDRTVTPTSMTARWVIPYQRTASVQLQPVGEAPEDLKLEIATMPWEWDDRTLRFGASNHTQRQIRTRPHSDWTFAEVAGRGFYVGDTLRVVNPVDDWWGAGDERFWVDGALAQVGTGTEDYYGYAYCSNELFSGPFGGQPQNDQPSGGDDCSRSAGKITNTRVRLLDRVLFAENLRFDLEIWHRADTTVDYSGTAFWYSLAED